MSEVEKLIVHGTVISHPQTSHRGSAGRRRQMYHASSAIVPMEITPSRTNGASGYGAIVSGTDTSRPCSAPGIWLCVQTTSAPKYGHRPPAYARSPIRKICVKSSKKNS